MLLRLGVIMALFALALAAGVAVLIGLRGEEEVSSMATLSSVEPQATEMTAATKENKFDLGEKLEIDDEPREEPSPEPPRERPKPRPEPTPEKEEAKPTEETTPLPAPIPDWPLPKRSEVSRAEEPRRFNPQPDAGMSLTVEALGLYDVPVISSNSLEALDTSLMHVPETSLPWDEGPQRNVYISGHYLGWPGTASRLVFYNLDKLRSGDEVVLKDGRGGAYRYQVSESFTAWPEESWVMGQELNRDMLTLQTCIPPDFGQRLIVRADRV